jgi:pimeloyl-ACP methyl ester carboxylesterase
VEHLEELVSSGRRGDAVEYFLTAAVGMPAEFVAPMRELPYWPGMEAVAHTIACDGRIVGDSMSGEPPTRERWGSVNVPVLVLTGDQSTWLSDGARAIAEALPNAELRVLEGQTHDVAPDVLAPAVIEAFG